MPTLLLSFLVLVNSSQVLAASAKEMQEAKQSIEALIRPLISGGTKNKPLPFKNFSVAACEKHKINWRDILFMRKEVTLNYRFKPGCDIQGTIVPKILKTFPASLDLRHLDHYSKVESQNKVTSSLESRPIIFLEMRSGLLSGKKGQVKFEADYQVRINPLKSDDPLEENLGGEIRITEIHGNKVSIKEKILVE